MWTDEAITELSANPNPLHINNVQMGAIDLFLTSSNCIVPFSFEHIFKKGISLVWSNLVGTDGTIRHFGVSPKYKKETELLINIATF